MVLGLSLQAFTILHVIISLVAIPTGLVVLGGMLRAQRLPRWTAIFLLTTVLTSVTGFMFPIGGFTPALALGGLSLVVLVVALLALYIRHLGGHWRWIYVATAVTALYFNVFVLVVQAFQKVPFLNPLAPTGSEPPFAIAQGVVLLAFVFAGIVAARRFKSGLV